MLRRRGSAAKVRTLPRDSTCSASSGWTRRNSMSCKVVGVRPDSVLTAVCARSARKDRPIRRGAAVDPRAANTQTKRSPARGAACSWNYSVVCVAEVSPTIIRAGSASMTRSRVASGVSKAAKRSAVLSAKPKTSACADSCAFTPSGGLPS